MPAPETAPVWCFVLIQLILETCLAKMEPSSPALNIGPIWLGSALPRAMYCPCVSSRKACKQHNGRQTVFGQANDDCSPLRLPAGEGISPAGTAAPEARTATQTGRRAGWRATIRASLFP